MFNPFWCVWQKKQNNYLSAALTGTVLFSTTILFPSATLAMLRDADSMYFKSGALPLGIKIQKSTNEERKENFRIDAKPNLFLKLFSENSGIFLAISNHKHKYLFWFTSLDHLLSKKMVQKPIAAGSWLSEQTKTFLLIPQPEILVFKKRFHNIQHHIYVGNIYM